jgi:hypothetical protein
MHRPRLLRIYAKSTETGLHSPNNRSHDTVIRVYDEAGNVIETHEHKGRFQTMEKTASTINTLLLRSFASK